MSGSVQHSSDDVAALLSAHQLRVTRQRQIVLAAMMREPNDVTAQSLHARLREEHPRLGLATVYRTLATLGDAGVLDRMHHADDGVCYRYCGPGHHHHLVCRACHTVVELRDCDLDTWAQSMAREHGFHEVEHTVELEGICVSCST